MRWSEFRVYWLGLTQTVAAFCDDALIYEPTFKLHHRSHFGGNLKGSVGRCTETICKSDKYYCGKYINQDNICKADQNVSGGWFCNFEDFIRGVRKGGQVRACRGKQLNKERPNRYPSPCHCLCFCFCSLLDCDTYVTEQLKENIIKLMPFSHSIMIGECV